MNNYKVYDYNEWVSLKNARDNFNPIFVFHCNRFFYSSLISKSIVEVSVYEIIGEKENIEILLPINKEKFTGSLLKLDMIQQEILLFLFSCYYKNKKYLIIPEKIFFEFRDLIDIYNITFIYKNNYIIQNKLILEILFKTEIFTVIYYLISKLGNKYYADFDRINLMKNLCDNCKIEYDLYEDHIEIFILTEKNLKYKCNRKEEMIFNHKKEDYILIKIGKYALFI